MSSLSSIVPGSRLRMRSLQLRLNSAGRLLTDSDSVSWDASCLEDLQRWSEESHLLVSLPLGLSHPSLSLFTDASDSGWGASLGDDHMSGSWSRHCSHFSVNHRELLAALYRVQGFLPLLRHRSVSLFADNTTALAYLWNQGGTLSSPLRLCKVHRVRLVPQFIPGCLNVLADTLSRRSQVLGSEWTLCFPAFRDLFSTVASDCQPLRNFVEPSPSHLLLADGGSTVSGHGCDDAAVGWSSGLCLPSLRPSPACHR